jgi:hypothetical protein
MSHSSPLRGYRPARDRALDAIILLVAGSLLLVSLCLEIRHRTDQGNAAHVLPGDNSDEPVEGEPAVVQPE